MKIRTDFVTNSSSSSFIIAFEKKPESWSDVAKDLFGDATIVPNPFYDPKWSPVAGYPVSDVASQVFSDLEHVATREELLEEFKGVIYNEDYYRKPSKQLLRSSNYDNICELSQEERIEAYNKDEETVCKLAEERVYDYLKENEGRAVYVVEYGDDSSLGSVMEHGDIFRKIKGIRISKH